MAYADLLNDQFPQGSIDYYIRAFGQMTVDDALGFVKTLPDGAIIAALPHAKPWTEELQKLIRESEEENKA
jgi:hypothetical protein